jgi:choline dehydrogenase
LTWRYETEPIPGLDGRRMLWPRGKVLGGSSSINGLIYIRGQPEDFDHWRQLGNAGWSYDDVLPYFRRAEDYRGAGKPHYGTGGPLTLSEMPLDHPLHNAFLAGAMEAGHKASADFNDRDQTGAGRYPLTVRDARRWSAADAYLRPAMGRANLRVITGALAGRILLNGRRAVGIEYTQDGQRRTLRATRGVILAGGAVNSPQLLQVSGIGPAGLLREHGIAVAQDLPGVGENLQDHLNGRVIWRVARPMTMNDVNRSRWRKLMVGLRYMALRGGPLAGGPMTLGMFARTRPEAATPDVQYHFFSGSAERAGMPMHPFPGCTISCAPCRPESRGWLRISSPDIAAPPAIQPNYLAAQADRDCLVAGLRIARRIFETRAMQAHLVGEVLPGPAVQTDDEWLDYLRPKVGTAFHPVGTCKMGNDAMAVVDERLSVRGIGGLRVVDASVMPSIISGNTNAAVVMIAEKAADIVRGTAVS